MRTRLLKSFQESYVVVSLRWTSRSHFIQLVLFVYVFFFFFRETLAIDEGSRKINRVPSQSTCIREIRTSESELRRAVFRKRNFMERVLYSPKSIVCRNRQLQKSANAEKHRLQPRKGIGFPSISGGAFVRFLQLQKEKRCMPNFVSFRRETLFVQNLLETVLDYFLLSYIPPPSLRQGISFRRFIMSLAPVPVLFGNFNDFCGSNYDSNFRAWWKWRYRWWCCKAVTLESMVFCKIYAEYAFLSHFINTQ